MQFYENTIKQLEKTSLFENIIVLVLHWTF